MGDDIQKTEQQETEQEANEQSKETAIEQGANDATLQALTQLITGLQAQVSALSEKVAANTVTPDMLKDAAIMVNEGNPQKQLSNDGFDTDLGTDIDFKAIEDLDLTGRR